MIRTPAVWLKAASSNKVNFVKRLFIRDLHNRYLEGV
jgi:hypothetical protein